MAQDFVNTDLTILKQIFKSSAALHNDLLDDIERIKGILKYQKEASGDLKKYIENRQEMLRSLSIAYVSLKASNTDLMMSLNNLREERKADTLRVESGIQRYTEQFLTRKERLENNNFYKRYNEALNLRETYTNRINFCHLAKQELEINIKVKQEESALAERRLIIEIAKYMAGDKLRLEEKIGQTQIAIDEFKKSNKFANREKERVKKTEENTMLPSLNLSFESTVQKSNIGSYFQKGMEKIVFNLRNIYGIAESKLQFIRGETPDESSAEALTPSFCSKPPEEPEDIETSKHIIVQEDVKINKDEAIKLISNINPKTTKIVDVIETEKAQENDDDTEMVEMVAPSNPENSAIEDDSMLIPPTQFKDPSQDLTESSERPTKRRVTFDLRDIKMIAENDVDRNDINDDKDQAENNMEDNDDGLIVAPTQFKNCSQDLKNEESLLIPPTQFKDCSQNMIQETVKNPVTSKFFANNETEKEVEEKAEKTINKEEEMSVIPEPMLQDDNQINTSETSEDVNMCESDAQLGDSMDLTINTTTYEESDNVPCIDPSLLLSPKGDYDKQTESLEEGSSETSFLTGMRKGLSMFGKPNSSDEAAANSDQPENNFNFDFGGSKRFRGSLFNMFK